ncbi:hypothetical protein R3P38DRAFT_2805164 [Favolaschia claudopus]|uniref:Uncharacterized protein n=1 Tax=Favolaschia claudopus TaxID=2862362 RepID=A0AAV9ZN29_9AGAR
MGQTRAVLVNPTSVVLEEQFLRDHHAWNFANPRPSIVQYPASTAATAGSEPSSPTNQVSDDGFPSPVLVAPPPSPDPKYIGTRSSQDFDGALVRTFDPANPTLALDSVAGDPLLRTLLHMKLGPALHQLSPSAEHVVPILRDGERSFIIHPTITQQFRKGFETIAGAILCAGSHQEYIVGMPLPMGIPSDALIEADAAARAPGICMFVHHIGSVTFENRYFNTVESAVDALSYMEKIRCHGVHWIANMIRRSAESGYFSSWGFGPLIGMGVPEWNHRIMRYFSYGGYSELAVYMRNHVEQSRIDFECARLVSPKARQLLYADLPTDWPGHSICLVTAWPLPDDQGLPAFGLVKAAFMDDGIEDVDMMMAELELNAREDEMEVDPAVI